MVAIRLMGVSWFRHGPGSAAVGYKRQPLAFAPAIATKPRAVHPHELMMSDETLSFRDNPDFEPAGSGTEACRSSAGRSGGFNPWVKHATGTSRRSSLPNALRHSIDVRQYSYQFPLFYFQLYFQRQIV
jgi:hypothetical protein